jgi:hypothetical protein
MTVETRAVEGSPSVRYLRSEDDKDRLLKIYHKFGKDPFTARELKNTVLPDTTSAEICKWDSCGLITRAQTAQVSTSGTSAAFWKIPDRVAEVLVKYERG